MKSKSGATIAAARVLVCIDAMRQGEMSGRLYRPGRNDSPAFTGVVALIDRMEQHFDALQYPLPTVEDRRFREGGSPRSDRKAEEIEMNNGKLEETRGEKATFVVRVQFRQNATWQGTIDWTEGKQTRRFRSMLELIKLMDDAVSDGNQAEFMDWNEADGNDRDKEGCVQ